VLNDTVQASPKQVNQGTVVRILLSTSAQTIPAVVSSTVVASGLAERTDPAALVIGPTGVVFDADHDVLYLADSLNNRIAAIRDAAVRRTSAGTGVTESWRVSQ